MPSPPRTFDPACVFLLDKPFADLFEAADDGDASFRCKGCGLVVEKAERRAHHARHRAGRTRSLNAAERKRQKALEEQLERARAMRKALAE